MTDWNGSKWMYLKSQRNFALSDSSRRINHSLKETKKVRDVNCTLTSAHLPKRSCRTRLSVVGVVSCRPDYVWRQDSNFEHVCHKFAIAKIKWPVCTALTGRLDGRTCKHRLCAESGNRKWVPCAARTPPTWRNASCTHNSPRRRFPVWVKYGTIV